MNRISVLIVVTLVGLVKPATSQPPTTDMIHREAASILPKIQEWRRQIHQHPELSNREYHTAEMVATFLKGLGLEVRTGVGKTGVVGVLRGNRPGPVIGLRADMDALPVKERVDIPFKSVDSAEYLGQKVPVMHACGHDSHVAMLMGTAQVLTHFKKNLNGTVVFIFQPAEEGPPGDEEGGAPLMIREGAMDNPKIDVIFGMHIGSNIEVGKIEYKSGAFMAASDWFTIKVKGKQSHGSQPWKGIDPIMVSAQIINGLQTVVSRQEPLTIAPVVITVGKIHGGLRNNIIPEECILDGTVRTLDAEMQKDVHRKMKLLIEKTAEANGAIAEFNIDSKSKLTYNDPDLVNLMLPSLETAVGKDAVSTREWTTGAEDFSYYGDRAPAFFFYIGGMPKGNDPNKAPPHHTPDFYIDDSQLDKGVDTFCQLVFDFIRLKPGNK